MEVGGRTYLRLLLYCALFLLGFAFEQSNEIKTENSLTVSTSTTTGVSSHEILDLGLLPVAEVYLASENENLTLLSKDGNSEIVIGEEMLRNSKEFQNIVLVCNAFFPIQWIYEGDGAPTRMYSSEIRTVGDMRNLSSYEYFSTVVLMPERNNEHLTGTYICQGVNELKASTYYHIYFSGRFGFPTIRNRVIRIPDNETQVLIPCMTTNPKMDMSFYKIFPKEETSNWTNNTAVKYNPRKGYIMDLTKVGNPYGTYYCSVNDQLSFWKIDLVPSKENEVQAEPNVELIQQEIFKNQTLRCKAKEKIKFKFPNFEVGENLEYGYNKSEEFSYSGTLHLHANIPSVVKYMKINCVSDRNSRILHSWEYSALGKEELKIKYDKNLQRILCCSKSGLSPIYEYVKCETKTDCLIKQECFTNGRCEYPFPPKYTDAPSGCTAIEFLERVPTHMAKCSVGDKVLMVPIIENIQKNDIVIDENGKFPETESILKLTALMNEKPDVKFKCSGSLYHFSANFVFGLEKADGTIEFAAPDSIEMNETHEPILKAKMDSSVRRIICFAPLTLSSEWRNVSMPVLISEPTRSKMSLSSATTTNARGGFTRRRFRS